MLYCNEKAAEVARNNTNEYQRILHKQSQIKRVHIIQFHFYVVQKQANLIHGIRNQNSGYH